MKGYEVLYPGGVWVPCDCKSFEEMKEKDCLDDAVHRKSKKRIADGEKI